jgi:hypothetical protein
MEADMTLSGVMPGHLPGIHDVWSTGIKDGDGTRNSSLPELRNLFQIPHVE